MLISLCVYFDFRFSFVMMWLTDYIDRVKTPYIKHLVRGALDGVTLLWIAVAGASGVGSDVIHPSAICSLLIAVLGSSFTSLSLSLPSSTVHRSSFL
jgi:hypothetical protein